MLIAAAYVAFCQFVVAVALPRSNHSSDLFTSFCNELLHIAEYSALRACVLGWSAAHFQGPGVSQVLAAAVLWCSEVGVAAGPSLNRWNSAA